MTPYQPINEEFLTTTDLYNRWQGKVKMGTIIQWRYLKRGPAYRKIGSKVIYMLEDVVKFEHGIDARFPIMEEEN